MILAYELILSFINKKMPLKTIVSFFKWKLSPDREKAFHSKETLPMELSSLGPSLQTIKQPNIDPPNIGTPIYNAILDCEN